MRLSAKNTGWLTVVAQSCKCDGLYEVMEIQMNYVKKKGFQLCIVLCISSDMNY